MFVQSYAVNNARGLHIKNVNKEVKFWARNSRHHSNAHASATMIFFDVRINGTFYFFSYDERSESFYYNGKYGVQKIGSCVPRVYYTVDGLQFCVTTSRLWVKQL